jgi:hypothetical protein
MFLPPLQAPENTVWDRLSKTWELTYALFKFILEIFMFYFFCTYYIEHSRI